MNSGFCIDLETTIAGRIPDTIRPSGQKRFETRIIEIGAVHWKNNQKLFKCLVNPIPKCSVLKTPEELFALLRSMHQKPDATLNFWSTVLVKRKSLDRKMFLHDEPPEIWRNRTIINRAKDFIRWHNNPSIGPDFKTESHALQELIQFTRSEPTWLAHNGNSFDFKVLQGCAERTKNIIPKNVNMIDTLKLFRQHIPGYKSYSQPKLYAEIFQRNYNAHVAIDDAKALAELCVHVNEKVKGQPLKKELDKKSVKKVLNKTRHIKKQMDLTFRKFETPHIISPSDSKSVRLLRGIGPKTESILTALNIRTIDQLKNEYNINGVDWLKRIVPRGASWRVIVSSLMV
jgi:DNA polymerase III epsilon subunit-like protein